MTQLTKLAGAGFAVVLVLLVLFALAADRRARERDAGAVVASRPAIIPSTDEPASETHHGFLYGRVTMDDGDTYEGRLRWGGDEEAFWGDTFNGYKDENPWAVHVPPDRLPTERREFEFFGLELGHLETKLDLGRPFMARFGDIARIEAHGRDIRVTLKSGTVFDLDRPPVMYPPLGGG